MSHTIRQHGEFKMPGGKLVQVDFRIAKHRLVDVEVSGDFFLYPEEALEAITSSLEGSPVDLDRVELRRLPEHWRRLPGHRL